MSLVQSLLVGAIHHEHYRVTVAQKVEPQITNSFVASQVPRLWFIQRHSRNNDCGEEYDPFTGIIDKEKPLTFGWLPKRWPRWNGGRGAPYNGL